MKQLVEINLTTKAAKNWTPPEIRFGETLTIAMRFSQNSAGDEIATYLKNATIKAAIGRVDARPQGGKFALKIGPAAPSPSNTTAPIAFNASASTLQSALNDTSALSPYGTARVVDADGSWLIFIGDQSVQVPLAVLDNSLWPVSFGRLHAWTAGGKWVHELRLTQSPVAFTSNVEVSQPKAPEITTLQDGGVSPDGLIEWNEIQQLYVPPDFQGSFILKMGFAKTVQLSREDGVSDIQEALQALGKDCFKVTLPLSNKPAIEFIGDYAGQDMSPLAVQVIQAPPGDATFTLTMDRAELAALLRREEAVTVPLEIRVSGEDEGGYSGELCALSLPVILRQPVIFADLENVPSIDWLRPHNFLNYVPFGENNVLTGQHYYTENVGDGSHASFAIGHGLNTEAVVVFVRENTSGGRQLVDGTDFTATIDTANQVTVTALLGDPALNAWTVIVLGAQAAPAWANGLTVTVPQVVAGDGYPSLADFMDNLAQRVTVLEQILPTVSVGVADAASGLIEIPIPEMTEALFYKGAEKLEIKDGELPELPRRAPIMLPAIHTATNNTSLPDPLPDPMQTAAGTLWVNGGADPVLIPGGGGIRSSYALAGGFVGGDGRVLYPATRDGATNSYFPAAFERELFAFFVSGEMLAHRRMELVFGISAALIAATSRASWLLEIQAGTAPQDTDPATTGPNLQNILWNPTPILRKRLVLTQELVTHTFGVRMMNTLEGMVCDVQNYGLWTGNNAAAPAEPNFALRARLINFDTENSRPDARGWVLYQLAGTSEGGKLKAFIS